MSYFSGHVHFNGQGISDISSEENFLIRVQMVIIFCMYDCYQVRICIYDLNWHFIKLFLSGYV